jgi:MULE transposase domain
MKYNILIEPSIRPKVYYFKCVSWAWSPYIEAFRYLRPVISINATFLSEPYEGRLLMSCDYDIENQLIPLAFALIEKKNLENWDWFMSWLRREVTGSGRICIIFDQHKAINGFLVSTIWLVRRK